MRRGASLAANGAKPRSRPQPLGSSRALKIGLFVILSPSPVIPSEALHRMVQGEARNLLTLGVNSARNLLFTKG